MDKVSSLAATSFAVIFLGIILLICFTTSIMSIQVGDDAQQFQVNSSFFDSWFILTWFSIVGSILGFVLVLAFGIKKGIEIQNAK